MEQKPQTGRFSREQVGPYGRDPDRQAKKKPAVSRTYGLFEEHQILVGSTSFELVTPAV